MNERKKDFGSKIFALLQEYKDLKDLDMRDELEYQLEAWFHEPVNIGYGV